MTASLHHWGSRWLFRPDNQLQREGFVRFLLHLNMVALTVQIGRNILPGARIGQPGW